MTTPLLAAAQVALTDQVLDGGCGCGATTLAARRASAAAAAGFDLTELMVKVDRRRASEEGITNALFVVRDAQTQSFPQSSSYARAVWVEPCWPVSMRRPSIGRWPQSATQWRLMSPLRAYGWDCAWLVTARRP